jgi:hypothetical protein
LNSALVAEFFIGRYGLRPSDHLPAGKAGRRKKIYRLPGFTAQYFFDTSTGISWHQLLRRNPYIVPLSIGLCFNSVHIAIGICSS